MGFFDLIKDIGLIELVDENDNITGFDYDHNIHKKGFRHRSVSVIITNKLLTDRSHNLIVSFSHDKFTLPIKTHLKFGQSYKESAYENINKLFSDKLLEQNLFEIGKYKNDHELDLENTCLFHLIYDGSIENTKDTQFIWVKPSDLIIDLIKYPNYSHSLKNAFRYMYKDWSKINYPYK
jgi:hypothetical protein